jgi:predicted small lipoprotein YifL
MLWQVPKRQNLAVSGWSASIGGRGASAEGRGKVLACDRLRVACALAVALAAALSLAGCGRKGPLDPPPSAAIPSTPPSAAASGPAQFFDPMTPTGNAQPARVQAAPASQPAQKSFLLDPLIQ